MKISDNKKLIEIQQEFSKKFPFLRIAFYRKAHKSGRGTAAQELIDPRNTTVGEVRTIHREGELSINGNLKVKTFEQEFAELFGLNVQVFRCSGNLWLQTTSTDEWTLAMQNRKGERSFGL